MMMDVLQATESNLELERSAAQEARETSTLLERKLIASQTELDDVRSLLEAVSISHLFYLSVYRHNHHRRRRLYHIVI